MDCGLFQGGKELRQRNWAPLPQDPATIDWVVLTHAHIDHTGYLPRLMRDGFRGPIFANAATKELCALLLPDSAHLMEEDAAHATDQGLQLAQAASAALYRRRGAGRARAISRDSAPRRIPHQPGIPGALAQCRPHRGRVQPGARDHRGQPENHRAFFRRPGPLRPADSVRPGKAAARRRGALRIDLRRSRPSLRSARPSKPWPTSSIASPSAAA